MGESDHITFLPAEAYDLPFALTRIHTVVTMQSRAGTLKNKMNALESAKGAVSREMDEYVELQNRIDWTGS